MLELKNEKIAIPVVLFSGLIWSFGPLVVRYMNEPQLVIWQYIFARGLTIFILLNLYLFFEEGLNFYKNYFKIGSSGIIGGSGLGIAMVTFIYSITNTSAAVTLLCLAAMPFFTALLGFLFLKGKLTSTNNGKLEIQILKGQESFRIKSFVDSNVWGVFKEGQSKFKKGELIECYSPTRSNFNILK